MSKDIYSFIKSTMAKCPSLKAEKLKEEGDHAATVKRIEEDKLLKAYADKKLKSKKAINHAKAILESRKAATTSSDVTT